MDNDAEAPLGVTITAARALLSAHGAETIPHPGGTLLAHLERVRETLAAWGAPPAVQLAGLCHACYGTDGFRTALLEVSERDTLVETIGPEAEALVYLYGSCDRERTYPLPGGTEPIVVLDRFTGKTVVPQDVELRAFAEITAANELDVLRHNVELAAEIRAWLRDFVTGSRHLLSTAAWEDCLDENG
jgi:hypothetical protein